MLLGVASYVPTCVRSLRLGKCKFERNETRGLADMFLLRCAALLLCAALHVTHSNADASDLGLETDRHSMARSALWNLLVLLCDWLVRLFGIVFRLLTLRAIVCCVAAAFRPFWPAWLSTSLGSCRSTG